MNSERERFAATEVAVVLSHYDLGVINVAHDFPRGSRKSPKLILGTAEGGYLLKRRAEGRDDPQKVSFSHTLLTHIRARRYPVPRVVHTRDDGGTMFEHAGRIYELFEFMKGEKFDGSLEQTMAAGKALARYHRAVQDLKCDWKPSATTFHDNSAVRRGLNSIPTTTAGHDSVIGHEAELLSIVQELHERYDEQAEAANKNGVSSFYQTVIHGDWHPGNLLFRGPKVAVVLDFDAAKAAPAVIDLANGMLQFSIIRGRGDPSEWPAFFDESRMRRFFMGYVSRADLSPEQVACLPHLMVESLIAESVVPIAVTGSFGPLPGFGILQMVRRKVRWLSGAMTQIEQWLRNA